jgi:hypothetical protein
LTRLFHFHPAWKDNFMNINSCNFSFYQELRPLSLSICLIVTWALISCVQLADAADQSTVNQVEIQQLEGKLQVRIGKEIFTEYRYAGYAKPILYPIYGPHEIAMTRSYPMREIDGEAHDHPHQKSMWFTHGLINGVDFWSEGSHSGTVVQERLIQAGSNAGRAHLETANRWLDPQGELVGTDTRRLTFSTLGDGARIIDWHVTMHASAGKLVFGDTKEGMMGIRTNPKLRLKNNPKHGVNSAVGHSLNSEGQQGNEAWGQPAQWIDYWATIDGHKVGVAIFDHPENPRHPTRWHARDYGLIAANPFALHDFAGQPRGTGNMTVPAGESVTFRYRFLFHQGDPQEADIPTRYQQYVKTTRE